MVKSDVKDLMTMRTKEIENADRKRISDIRKESETIADSCRKRLELDPVYARDPTFFKEEQVIRIKQYRSARLNSYLQEKDAIINLYNQRKNRLLNDIYMIRRFPDWFPALEMAMMETNSTAQAN